MTLLARVGPRGWTLLVVAGLIGGVVGLAAAALCVALVVTGRVAPRRLLWGALGVALLLPVVWVVGNVGRLGSFSVAVVSRNQPAQWCGLLLVVILLCGVFLEQSEETER